MAQTHNGRSRPKIESMEDWSKRATDAYMSILRDDAGTRQEIEDQLEERFKAASLTFGGRVLCPFAMPQFVSRHDYDLVRRAARGIYGATVKAWRALGPKLHDAVGLTDAERQLVALDPGTVSPSPLSRLDSFLSRGTTQFVELNAETPAGLGYAEVLSDIFEQLEVMKRLRERFLLHRPQPLRRLLETLVTCYRAAQGQAEKPSIAVVDYDEVPTRSEHRLIARFFEAAGHRAVVCDPRTMTFEGGRLRANGEPIDIVYKRLLVNELIERAPLVKPLVEAARSRACVFVNPFACKPIHKKAIFAVLTDDDNARFFDAEEREAIRAHVPWTRVVRESKTHRNGHAIDLIPHLRAPENKDGLVLKPNDEYGGKGVFLGFECTSAEWERAIEIATREPYVVQEKVEIAKQSFPVLASGLPSRDLVVDLDPYLFFGEVEGFLTRLSASSLANVTSGGGQVPAFVVESTP